LRFVPHSWLITGFVPRLTRLVPLDEQELLSLFEHLSSPLVFNGVLVTRSLVLCVCFVDRCLSFCSFFGHCVVCSSSIYRFWLLLWSLQTLLNRTNSIHMTTSVSRRLNIWYEKYMGTDKTTRDRKWCDRKWRQSRDRKSHDQKRPCSEVRYVHAQMWFCPFSYATCMHNDQ
jgi:hypothetical protein